MRFRARSFRSAVRQGIAAGLSVMCPVSLAWSQQFSIQPVKPSAPVIVRPYRPVTVPPIRQGNSPRLGDLVRAGALYLTAQDAIALALENNIDIEVARYNPIIAAWNVERAEAGGALPGVPSSASQAGTVAAGQGVAGSQAAAGVRLSGTGTNTGQTANATISQIGPVTQTLDPSIQETSTFSHISVPQFNIVQSLTPVLIEDTRAHSASYQQGLLSGGSVTVRYTDNYLKENSPTDLLNPSSATSLSISAQHNLLRGFGVAVNARTITIQKMNLSTSDLNFRTQVIAVVAQVLNQYYGLSSAYEDLRAKRNVAEVARTFVGNVKQQIEAGSVAPPDLINAQALSVTGDQAVVGSEATLKQQEIRLKNLLSRNGIADPVMASVRIVPVDRIVIPEKDDLQPLDAMVQQALANRADLGAERAGEESNEVSLLGTTNGLLPNLQVFAAASASGLAGTPHLVGAPGQLQSPDPYFVGGIGTALGQTFRRNFPTQRAGLFMQAPLRNRQAQADFAIEQLQFRQTQLTTQKDLNQVQVAVLNNVIALQQARARYDAAVKNRVLQNALFEAEQKRYNLGTSTPYNVIQQQRDLTTAQSNETASLVQYSNARIALDQTLGATLEANRISIAEARDGTVVRPSVLPAELPKAP